MNKSLKKFLNHYSIYLVLVLLIAFFSFTTQGFFSVPNMMSMLTSWSIKGLIALGVGMVIISRGIDLSSGAVVGLASVMAASFAQDAMVSRFGDLPIVVPILAACLVGILAGLINGSLVAYARVPPFIATLGTMTVARGLALMYTQGFPVSRLKPDFMIMGRAMIGRLPLLVLFFIVATVIVWVLLNQTSFGKNVYAIGGNQNAARVSGVSVEKNLIAVYMIASLLAAIGGILMAARTAAGNATYGVMYELDAIAAVTVGGISHSGGIGTVSNMIAGIMILAVVENGLILLGVSPYMQQVVKGLIIVGAVVYDMNKNKRR